VKESKGQTQSNLQRLESEAIHIIREVAAEAKNPVMLYSIGKDSSVMLHLAKKAFYPGKLPFPLLHVDTTWKFSEMYALREKVAKQIDIELIVHQNENAKKNKINPFEHGALHTDMWKTEGLIQAIDKYRFDFAFGGARRDEEKSRAKERILSLRSKNHRWDPKKQRPEFWNLYNMRKNDEESFRVFPLSNWTELDIWTYIYKEGIEVVPLYYSSLRSCVKRDDLIIMVDDDRFIFKKGEIPVKKHIRFRTLGCYPLTGAIESKAITSLDIIKETIFSKSSERQGRAIDSDEKSSMEIKKQQGYF